MTRFINRATCYLSSQFCSVRMRFLLKLFRNRVRHSLRFSSDFLIVSAWKHNLFGTVQVVFNSCLANGRPFGSETVFVASVGTSTTVLLRVFPRLTHGFTIGQMHAAAKKTSHGHFSQAGLPEERRIPKSDVFCYAPCPKPRVSKTAQDHHLERTQPMLQWPNVCHMVQTPFCPWQNINKRLINK